MMQNRFSRICLRATAVAAVLAAVIFALPAGHSFGATGRANQVASSDAQYHAPLTLLFDRLYSFTGGSDGSEPQASLLRDASGNLYGTTIQGGDPSCNYSGGCGTVFKIDATGHFSVFYAFTSILDGAQPYGSLIEDAAGNLYGTTKEGGDSLNYGAVFEVDSTGHETVLHSFRYTPDGGYPVAGLVMDTLGNLYGTTQSGGTYGNGTVYELTPQSGGGYSESILYSFGASPDGLYPDGTLLLDSAGNLYGTTAGGGANCGLGGCGTVFELSPNGGGGWNEMILHSFTNSDGAMPYAGLIADSDGNLYGTTFAGGHDNCKTLGFDGCGVVFKLDASGNETVLYAFTGLTDGAAPAGSLIRDAAGNLYGTTQYGGLAKCGPISQGCGVIFKLGPRGHETILFTSNGGPGGALPVAGLITDGAGHAYGTASAGGDAGDGTVFRITF